MSATIALDILLYGQKIGRIDRLGGDRSIFSFTNGYLEGRGRPTLSLAYRDQYGAIIDAPRSYQTKIEPFFSNLLPEGILREYLAERAGIKAVREFPLLSQLGEDLPGAVQAVPVDGVPIREDETGKANVTENSLLAMRFSLAGVQLKFSALKSNGKNVRLTIPANGSGGDWIIKLPSPSHVDVPENEFAAMTLAQRLGIEVPEIELVGVDAIEGLPDGFGRYGKSAFAIRRFDRTGEEAIHIEDFAQVFGVYPDAKYENASHTSILKVLANEADDISIVEFIRRMTYNILIGNGDMHLKNWSLIYPDRRRPILSPAYDLLSTIMYIPGDKSALKIGRSREWQSFTYDELVTIADKARISSHMIVNAAQETVEQFDDIWANAKVELPFTGQAVEAIERHRKTLAV